MKKKKPVIHHDNRGEFRWEIYFVGGKQKKRKVRMVCGIDQDDFIENHADDVFLQQNGYYEILHAKEEKRRSESGIRTGIDALWGSEATTRMSRQPE